MSILEDTGMLAFKSSAVPMEADLKLNAELTPLVRQLVIGKQQNVMAANQARLCGICCAADHPTNAYFTL